MSFPHHGGRPGSADIREYTKNFCEAVTPDGIIFSIGRDKHKNPQPAIVSTIREILPDTFILCTQISKHCAVTIESTYEKHLADAFAHGREKGHCCAGTIVVEISKGRLRIQPQRDSHEEFIKEIVQNPICFEEDN